MNTFKKFNHFEKKNNVLVFCKKKNKNKTIFKKEENHIFSKKHTNLSEKATLSFEKKTSFAKIQTSSIFWKKKTFQKNMNPSPSEKKRKNGHHWKKALKKNMFWKKRTLGEKKTPLEKKTWTKKTFKLFEKKNLKTPRNKKKT